MIDESKLPRTLQTPAVNMSQEPSKVIPTDLIETLRNYGLTKGESKLYLFLVGRPPLQASVISRQTDIHRVDTYRILRELEERGLVEIHLGSPKRFSAASPKSAVASLVHRVEARVSNLRDSAREFEQVLESYEKQNRYANSTIRGPRVGAGEDLYRLVVGRERYYKEIHKTIRNSEDEILRILSANGILRTFSGRFFQDYVKARARGVKIRLITEVSEQNRARVKKLSEIVEIRHLQDVHLRFGVVDKKVTLLSVRLDDKNLSDRSDEDSYLFSNDPVFAETARFLFEHLWNSSRPLDLKKL